MNWLYRRLKNFWQIDCLLNVLESENTLNQGLLSRGSVSYKVHETGQI